MLKQTFQAVPLSSLDPGKDLRNATADCRELCKRMAQSFEARVLHNTAWLIPSKVLEGMDCCFDFPVFLAGEGVTGVAREEAFLTVATYCQRRWPWTISVKHPTHLRRQYANFMACFFSASRKHAGKLWKESKFQWCELWRLAHIDKDFFGPGTRDAFFVFHACGSILSSEAFCESLASQLKRFTKSGIRAGRAVEKCLLSENEGAVTSAPFLLRAWAETSTSFRCVRERRRERSFPLGGGSKTIHNTLQRRRGAWTFEKVRSLSRLSTFKRRCVRAWERTASKKLQRYG